MRECARQQRLGLFQIERIKTLGEPAVYRSEKIAGLIPLTLIAVTCAKLMGLEVPQYRM